MTYVKINKILYPAEINGKLVDNEWGKRDSKTITSSTAIISGGVYLN